MFQCAEIVMKDIYLLELPLIWLNLADLLELTVLVLSEIIPSSLSIAVSTSLLVVTDGEAETRPTKQAFFRSVGKNPLSLTTDAGLSDSFVDELSCSCWYFLHWYRSFIVATFIISGGADFDSWLVRSYDMVALECWRHK